MKMHNGGRKHPLKTLMVDITMGLIFVLLLVVAVWLVWIYYFRGPIEIVTSRAAAEAEQQLLTEAREEYSTHFHNLDHVVLAGIRTGSLCLECHGDYPHSEHKKVRALFNAHSWFMACEVCHLKLEDGAEVVYRWFNNDTGEELEELQGEAGVYGGTIVPVKRETWGTKRLDKPVDEDFIREILRTQDQLGEDEKEAANERIHKDMLKEPIFCDECHKTDGFLDFAELLYPPHTVLHLETIDMGAMAKVYEDFYLPDITNRHTR